MLKSKTGEKFLPLFLFLMNIAGKSCGILLILFFAFIMGSCGKKSSGKISGREIRIGMDRDNAPFSYLDKENNPVGFDVELIEGISKLEGFTVKFVPMNPSALQSAVVTGTIVGAMGGMEIREEKQLAFSEAYGSAPMGLLYRKDESVSSGQPSLEGKSILVKEGSGTAIFLESIRQEEGFSLLVVQENQDLIREWMEGNGEFIAEDLPVLEAMKDEIQRIEEEGKGGENLSPELPGISEFHSQGEKNIRAGQDIEIFSFPEQQSYGLMVGKGQNKELLRAFSRGLKKMKEDGEWEALTQKYSLFAS